jgi:predicted PilT family ATPase
LITKIESIALALVDQVRSALSAKVTREAELPVECPDEGIVNIVPSEPREMDRRLGTGIREMQQDFEIEIVVKGSDQGERGVRMEGVLVPLGAALGPLALIESGVDYINLNPPSETEVIPMRGSESLRGTVVVATLFYETSSNVMETAT